jgi:dCTP deaminase
MLTGPEIGRQVELGNIVIDPFDESRLNPNSYNMRLAPLIKVYERVYCVHCEWLRLYERHRGILLQNRISIAGLPLPIGFIPEPLDVAVEQPTVDLPINPEKGLLLFPGVLYLGSTEEHTESPCFVPTIEGRSSWARLGISVHLTAGFGDTSFRGEWCLELTVVHPTVIRIGQICQIAYTRPEGEIMPYQGRYQDQKGPQPSKLWQDFQRDTA